MGAVKKALTAKAYELGLDPLRMHEYEDVLWFEIQHEACRRPIVVCNTRTQDTREVILRAAFVQIGDKPQPHVLYNGYWRAVERVGGVLTILDNRPRSGEWTGVDAAGTAEHDECFEKYHGEEWCQYHFAVSDDLASVRVVTPTDETANGIWTLAEILASEGCRSRVEAVAGLMRDAVAQ